MGVVVLMFNLDNKKIIELLNRKVFSELSFLDDVWATSENESYLGFYYFLKELRNDEKTTVFDEIVLREGSHSLAYLYIGKMAQEIYNKLHQRHIAKYFFLQAMNLDKANSEAHWNYYWLTRDLDSLLSSLKIDYESEKFILLQNKILNIYIGQMSLDDFCEENWVIIKKIFGDERVKNKNNRNNVNGFLALANYFLGEFNEGVIVIKNSESVSLNVIKLYLDSGYISLDQALLKLSLWDREKILKDDHKKIYKEYLIEAEKGLPNPIKDELLKKAFYAGEYLDVLSIFDDKSKDQFSINSIDSYLYCLISQIALKHEINIDLKRYVEEHNFSLSKHGKESELLYLVFKFKLIIKELNFKLLNEIPKNHTIDIYSNYQDACEILENENLFNHSLYKELESELRKLSIDWNELYYQDKFSESFSTLDIQKVKNTELWEHCNAAINNKKYDYVISLIKKFYVNNTPTMTSENILGVCYEYKEDYYNSLIHLQKSIDIMYLHKELDFIIISNYVSVARKNEGYKIPEEFYLKLKADFNLSLVSRFKWDYSCSDRSNFLFKYSPFNINSIDSISNQYFYLPNKNQLNDPIELPELSVLTPDSLISTDYNVCSFSNNENSILMWSHYAQQHEGIMVEYWFGGEFPEGYGISKLNYSDSLKRKREQEPYIFNQFLLTKNKEWSYEDEVRLFSPIGKKVGYTSYEYPNFDRSKINARIISITLGYRFPEDKKGLISNLIKTINSQLKPYDEKIKLKQAYIDEFNNFSIVYKDHDLI